MRCQSENISVGQFFGTTRRVRLMVASSNVSTVRYPDLTDVLARIADHPVNRIDELLPWNIAE